MLTWLAATAVATPPTLTPTVGYHQLQLLDQHQSPVQYATHGTRIGARLDLPGERLLGWVDVGATIGNAAAPSLASRGLPGTIAAGGAVEVGSLFRLGTVSGSSFWAGAGLRSGLDYIDGVPLHPWGLATTTADARVAWHLDAGKTSVRLGFGVPVAGLLTRHNWSLDPVVPGADDITAFYLSGTRFMSGLAMPTVRGRLELRRPINERLSAQVVVRGSTLFHALPMPIRTLDLGASAGLTIRLGGDA